MAKASKPDKPNYQQLSSELDQIMIDLSREDIDVDEALSKYKRGLELVQELEVYLKTAETTVSALQAQFE